ncbi:treacle protein isoform X2 [Python bivittatus]|uniref:Treacle protein isoform X2 n=1 Tax=Python bivittatus TaxID=176946 RepID=A0A9F2R0T6_PYTBI|nr:treacle protein isoform X2 [Python bivittatus]
MAVAAREQKELLALMHQQLVQMGYERAAKELLDQSGQKSFPSSSISLKEIITHWRKTSSQSMKQKTIESKRGTPVKIRIPDPKSSSESSEEEEAAKTITTNLPGNNSTELRETVAKEESSSEDSDSSSEEEAVARKTVKNPVAENKAEFLQLADQNTNSVPGKGVAVAAVQAKGKQNKSASNKPLPPAVRKAGPNKGLSSKAGPPSQSLISGGQKTAQTTLAKAAESSESSSSTSESEEGATSTVVKAQPSKPSLKKTESTSEDSSDDSDSEEGSKAPAVQVKPAVQNAQVSSPLVKKSPATAGSSTRNAVKVTPAKQTSVRSGNAKKSTESTDTSESSDSSDSEAKEPALVAQLKLSGKNPQTFKAPAKNAASSSLNKAVSASSPSKSTQKPPATSLAKPPPPSKEAQSSESSESSSESENETLPVPISQKRLLTPRPSVGTKQNQADQPGIVPKAASGALKGKEAQNESTSSSDSEDETVPTPCKLPAPSAPKASPAVQDACKVKPQPPEESHQKAQQSEDSSEDSSDDSDSEEDATFTQKPAQITRKPALIPVKSPTAKNAGITSGKPQPAGKGGTTRTKSGAVPVPEASESSETSSSDSSDSKEAEKPAAQPPIHPFFKQMTGKTAIPSGKGVQTTLNTPNAASSKCQSPATKATGKEGQAPSQKAKPGQGQVLAAKSSGITIHKESSSDSSSDSEEEAGASTTAKQPAQPAIQQKQEAKKESESSSEESSDEDLEASQSLLAGLSGPSKIQASTVAAGPLISKQSSGKASTPTVSAQAKASGKPAPADSTSSAESSSSSSEAEETVIPKTEIVSLPSSGREAAAAKVEKGARKRGLKSTSSKAPPAKKAAAKAQSNGQAPGTSAVQLPESLTPLSKAASGNKEQAAPQVSLGTQEDAHSNPVGKAKMSKTGTKEKSSKKRKLAAGDADPEVSKGKKLKMQSGEEKLIKKKKKKKKSKSSDNIKSPKKKNVKEKKSDKKKKKSKNVERLDADGTQKKKKKKKKIDNLEEKA